MDLRSLCLAVCAFAWLPASAIAQSHVVINKTLISDSAHRECLGVTDQQSVRYWYRADAPIDFKIEYVQGMETIRTVTRDKQAIGSGSFSPKETRDYCMVWTNVGRRPVLVRVELARLAR